MCFNSAKYCTQYTYITLKMYTGLLLNKPRPGTSFQPSKSKFYSSCFYIPSYLYFPTPFSYLRLVTDEVFLIAGVRQLTVNNYLPTESIFPPTCSNLALQDSVSFYSPGNASPHRTRPRGVASPFKITEVIKISLAPAQSFAKESCVKC